MLRIRRAARSVVPVAVATLLAGVHWPDYKRPDAAMTEQYKNPIVSTAQPPPDRWWTAVSAMRR